MPKSLPEKLNQKAEIKFTQTFAEKINLILKTWLNQTWNFANETEPILEAYKINQEYSRRKEPAPKWLDQKTRQIITSDN